MLPERRLIELDTRTLFILAVPSAFLFAAVQLAVWSVRRTDRALALWACGNLIGCVGALGITARGLVPDLVSIALANALLVGSLCAVWAGMRSFSARSSPLTVLIGIPVLTFVLLGLVPVVAERYSLRVVVTSLMLGTVNLLTAIDLQRFQRGEPLRARLFLVWTFAFSAVFYFWRAWASRNVAPDSNVLVPDVVSGATLLIANLKMLAWNLGALLMANERMQARLILAATCDSLTQVLNRAGFRDLAERQRRRSVAANQPLSVLLMDLDRFKSVNDRFGHDAGDNALCEFAAAAREALRPTDLLGRLGGEEFCVLLPQTDLRAALDAGERVRAAVARMEVFTMGRGFHVTVSVGVAQIRLPDETVEAALSRADRALYRAKAAGRDRVMAAEGWDEAGAWPVESASTASADAVAAAPVRPAGSAA